MLKIDESKCTQDGICSLECPMGIIDWQKGRYPPLKAALGTDKGINTYGAMMAGYPAFSYPRMPPRNAPRITWVE